MAENNTGDLVKSSADEVNRLTSLLHEKEDEIKNFRIIITGLQSTIDNLTKQIENLNLNFQNLRQPDSTNIRKNQTNTANAQNQKNKVNKRRNGDEKTNSSNTQNTLPININKKTKKNGGSNQANEKKTDSNEQINSQSEASQNNGGNTPPESITQMDTDQFENTPTNSDESSQKNTLDDCQSEIQAKTNESNNEWQFVSYKNKTENNCKIQPIQVSIADEGFGALYNNLQNTIGNNNFTINQLKSKTSVRVYPASTNIAGKIIETLCVHGYEFHSYLDGNSKKKCFLIEGLNGFNNTNVIREQLIKAGLPNDLQIQQFATGFQRANPNIKHNTFFKLIVKADMDEKLLKNVNSLYGVSIVFEKLKPSQVVQCHNCQAYFHTASMCYRKYRCVKCTSSHEPGECPANSNETLNPQCVNCNGFHTANNHAKCDYFKQKVEPFIKRKTTTTAKATENSTSSVNGNEAAKNSSGTIKKKSFAEQLMGNNYNNKQKTVSKPNVPDNVTSGNNASSNSFERMFGLLTKMMENQDRMLNHLLNKEKS